MLLIIGLVAGGVFGFLIAACFGASKIADLEVDRAYYMDQCSRLWKKLEVFKREDMPK